MWNDLFGVYHDTEVQRRAVEQLQRAAYAAHLRHLQNIPTAAQFQAMASAMQQSRSYPGSPPDAPYCLVDGYLAARRQELRMLGHQEG